MNVYFTGNAWDDCLHWAEDDQGALAQVLLIEDARRHPFTGLGKPEPLKGDFAGWWSRRISRDHRLIYRIEGKSGDDQRIMVAGCRYHHG